MHGDAEARQADAHERDAERLKNWRRVTPRVSASGGVHGAGAADRAGSTAVERSATAARSTSRPVTAGSSSAVAGGVAAVPLAGLA